MDSEQRRANPHYGGWRGLPRMRRRLSVTWALYQPGSCHHISLVSVHPRSYISMRHHSLTYPNSLRQSKEFQDYQAQGEFSCRTYFKGTDDYGLVTASCLTLCHAMDCSPPGSSVHGILQARTQEWATISFSNRCLWKPSNCNILEITVSASGQVLL